MKKKIPKVKAYQRKSRKKSKPATPSVDPQSLPDLPPATPKREDFDGLFPPVLRWLMALCRRAGQTLALAAVVDTPVVRRRTLEEMEFAIRHDLTRMADEWRQDRSEANLPVDGDFIRMHGFRESPGKDAAGKPLYWFVALKDVRYEDYTVRWHPATGNLRIANSFELPAQTRGDFRYVFGPMTGADQKERNKRGTEDGEH